MWLGMSERQHIFEVQELARLSYKCVHCGTVIVFDMETDEKFGLPRRCSTCQEALGAAAEAFAAYRDFYRGVVRSKVPMRLHAVAAQTEE
jgi:DNA-directed RNA polymerase subunit RPC12/RpoP